MLQDLCPACGGELLDASRPCPACGFDRIESHAPQLGSRAPGIHLGPTGLAALALGVAIMLIVAFRAGVALDSTQPAAVIPESPSASEPAMAVVAPIGRVRFAERLGESLELEAYRTQFTREDTIAWRAEFVEPPGTSELTLVITWVSIRERMQLSEVSVPIGDAELTMIATDELPLRDLVPTAGMYEVAYYAGDVKLAIGVFELLPPAR